MVQLKFFSLKVAKVLELPFYNPLKSANWNADCYLVICSWEKGTTPSFYKDPPPDWVPISLFC